MQLQIVVQLSETLDSLDRADARTIYQDSHWNCTR